MRQLVLVLALVLGSAGCTILPSSPGWDPSTGTARWDLDLNGDGTTDGRWTMCVRCGTGGNSWEPAS